MSHTFPFGKGVNILGFNFGVFEELIIGEDFSLGSQGWVFKWV